MLRFRTVVWSSPTHALSTALTGLTAFRTRPVWAPTRHNSRVCRSAALVVPSRGHDGFRNVAGSTLWRCRRRPLPGASTA